MYLPKPRVTDVNVKWRTQATWLDTSFLRLKAESWEGEAKFPHEANKQQRQTVLYIALLTYVPKYVCLSKDTK